MSIKNTSSASLRFSVSDGATAAIATAFLHDLIENGHLDLSKSFLAVDRSKIHRGKLKAIKAARVKGERCSQESDIKGIFFDGRKNLTRVMKLDEETGRYHPRVEKQNHIAVTSEPDGIYRLHFTPPEAIPPSKPAREEALALHEWMVNLQVDKTVEVLGGDSTNPMSGWKGGAIAWLERMLGRKVFWVICMLHTNELLLRHLIENLDGKTSSKDGFTGPIGKLLSQVNTMERNFNFKVIPGLEDLLFIPQDIVERMSSDSSIFYQLGIAVRTGKLSQELASKKCGNLVHSRWLTTGEALLFLWMSHHGLEGEVLKKLELIVTFVVQVYQHMYFEIKVKHAIVNGPGHILTQLRLLRQQPKEVIDIVAPFARTGAWFAHSEAVILSLISSPNREEREFGVARILERRKDDPYGDTKVRPRKTPYLNMDATTLSTLISWKLDIHEPIFTCYLSRDEIKKLIETPFPAPYYPLHTQSTERVVQQVTEAAAAVVGFKARDGYIRAKQTHRKLLPKFTTKQDILSIFKDE